MGGLESELGRVVSTLQQSAGSLTAIYTIGSELKRIADNLEKLTKLIETKPPTVIWSLLDPPQS